MRVRPLVFAVLLVSPLLSQAVRAQPDTGAPPIAPNPANVTPEAQRKQAMEQAAAVLKMTPEQQKEMLRKLMEQSLRAQLSRIGVTGDIEQAAILECIASQEKERAKVRAQAAKVFNLTRAKNDPATDANMNLLLNGYLAAVDDAKVQREEAARALDAKISFSQKPQLLAFLTLMGIIGEASWFTGDLQLVGSMSIGSLAMDGKLPR
jgi:hypothetical protein